MENKSIHLDKSYEKNINEIIKNINLTITKYGTLKLYEMLHIILTDSELLNKRQNIIKNTINNKFITDKLENLLNKIDDKIIYTWFEQNFENNNYSSFDFLNMSFFLSIKNKIHYFLVLLILISTLFLFYNIKNEKSINITLKISILLSFIIQIIITLKELIKSFQLYKNQSNILIEYKKIYEIVIIINKIMESDIFLIDEKTLINSDLEKLKNIFNPDLSIGEILLMRKNKIGENEFSIVLQYIGILDVFIMISKLITLNQFTIPTFDFDKFPTLIMTNIQNPINTKNKIKNDINIDDCFRFIVLTGNKSSGKTNYSNSILSSVILSQTLGIAPCSKITLSPFNKIIFVLDGQHYMEKINELKKISKNDKTLIIFDDINLNSSFYIDLSKFLDKHNNIAGLITTTYFTKSIEIKSADYVKIGKKYVIYKGKKIKKKVSFL